MRSLNNCFVTRNKIHFLGRLLFGPPAVIFGQNNIWLAAGGPPASFVRSSVRGSRHENPAGQGESRSIGLHFGKHYPTPVTAVRQQDLLAAPRFNGFYLNFSCK